MGEGERERHFVTVLRTATRVANDAETLDEAAGPVLAAVCAATGWPVGHLCVPADGDRSVFVSSGVWHVDGAEPFTALREVTARTRFPMGAGIVGRAAAAAAPVWSADAVNDAGFIRDAAATGVGAALAFPILGRGGVAGVLEFFTDRPTAPDARVLDVMGDVGTLLGRVADRLAGRAALAESADRLAQIIETSVEAFVSMDQGGRITSWNAAAERVFGVPRAAALGRRLAETIVPPRFRDAHRAGVDRFLATGERRVLDQRIEITAWHSEGYEFPVELAIWAVEDPTVPVDSGRRWTFNAFVHDITERRKGDEALRSAYEQEVAAVARLRELDEAKRSFVATVSHELRTPLSNVVGHTELLSGGDVGKLDDEQLHHVDVIGRNANRLRTLIEDLLTVSRIEAGAFSLLREEVQVSEVVDRAYTAVEALARRRGQELSLERPARLGTVVGDADQLQRAVVNLLSNAVKFTPDGGRIDLLVHGKDDTVEIVVSDNGIGIDPAELPRLFTRFFRGEFAIREAVQGTGLGLAIAKTIVAGHGGEIEVQSAPGAGATFTVRLPR